MRRQALFGLEHYTGKHLSKARGATKYLLEAALKGVEEVLMDRRFNIIIRENGVQRSLTALIEGIFLAVAGLSGQNPIAVQFTSDALKELKLPINLRAGRLSNTASSRER